MTLQWEGREEAVRVLLDTGCSVPLISRETVRRMGIPQERKDKPTPIRNCSGEEVPGSGEKVTVELILRHRRHYTREIFEVAPLEPGVDVFLPFWWISQHPLQGAWESIDMRFSSPQCLCDCTKWEANEFSLTLDDGITQHPDAKVIGYVSAVSEEEPDPLAAVSKEFREYLCIMGTEAAEALSEYKSYDCKIDLNAGEIAPWGPIYPLSEKELETLRDWLKEMLRIGKIQHSTCPVGSPILLVPKSHGRGLRLCVDYRALNKVTVPNQYPLPLMQELQDQVQGTQWFTKMDLKNRFHLIRIREGDESKTAFRTRYGLYEFQVMPFGLTNAPSTFQDMMNHVFSDMLDTGLMAYMDNIIVYAKTREEHDEKVKEVLTRLTENGLAVSPDKCVWRVQEVEFLGYVIGREGIKMSREKVEAVLSWRTPESLTDTQSFRGFANFYWRFIQDYSWIARLLTELTKGEGKNWAWNKEAEMAFREVKHRFTTAPILAYFNREKPVIIETDALDFTIGAVLSQRDPEERLHPVAFHSRKFQPAEINYEIHDKELLAIVDVFKHWHRYCEGATYQVQVYSDNQNLEYFTTTKVLNCRQVRWALELAGIDFRIYYWPGSRNGKPDALSRRSKYRPEKGVSENQPIMTVLNKEHFAEQQTMDERRGRTFICSSVRLASIPPRKWSEGFPAKIKEKGKTDKEYQ